MDANWKHPFRIVVVPSTGAQKMLGKFIVRKQYTDGSGRDLPLTTGLSVRTARYVATVLRAAINDILEEEALK